MSLWFVEYLHRDAHSYLFPHAPVFASSLFASTPLWPLSFVFAIPLPSRFAFNRTIIVTVVSSSEPSLYPFFFLFFALVPTSSPFTTLQSPASSLSIPWYSLLSLLLRSLSSLFLLFFTFSSFPFFLNHPFLSSFSFPFLQVGRDSNSH